LVHAIYPTTFTYRNTQSYLKKKKYFIYYYNFIFFQTSSQLRSLKSTCILWFILFAFSTQDSNKIKIKNVQILWFFKTVLTFLFIIIEDFYVCFEISDHLKSGIFLFFFYYYYFFFFFMCSKVHAKYNNVFEFCDHFFCSWFCTDTKRFHDIII
jgi:hypothetical protein